jgi:hypothetical protein
LQWGYGEGNKVCVCRALPFIHGDGVVEFEVLEVREESNEIQDLSARTLRFLEGKESKCWREVSEALLDVRHKAGYLEMVYSKLLEVRERGKVRQGAPLELFGSELAKVVIADSESFGEWKQTKLVGVLERSRPEALFTALVAETMVVGCEGVMKMGGGSDVPRVTCRGARQESARVVSEVGDNQSHELLRELGDWGGMCSGRLWGASAEHPLDFGFDSVLKLINKQFNGCNGG